MTRVALITIAHGRHRHWQAQRTLLAQSHEQPAEHILVAMDDPELAELTTDGTVPAQVIPVTGTPLGLPLAAARNAGAAAALGRGAEVLIFLDVDCLPDPALIGSYRTAATARATRHRILCGPVTYLAESTDPSGDAASLALFDDPHDARPAPARGETQLGGSHDLFWSLSFAVHASTWRRIGGFDEGYVGYGGEDTDFAWTARERGVDLAWIGDARAYHQFHPVQDPPVGHLDDILRNAARFHDRWGSWPMGGWLRAFEESHLIERIGGDGAYRRRRVSAPALDEHWRTT